MNAVLEQFVKELGAQPDLVEGAGAEAFAQAFEALELEGVKNWHARRFMQAVTWILQQPRTVAEKLEAIEMLVALPRGPRIVSMPQLTGWDT